MDGYVAVIFGGASGIGKACVDLLLSKEIKVCFADINDNLAADTVRELSDSHKDASLIYHHCDVTNEGQIEDAIKATIQRYDRLDIIINSAGILNESCTKTTVDINLNGAINVAMLGLKYLSNKAGGSGGSITLLGSTASLTGFHVIPVYTATKHAILGLTRALGATSISNHGVRINCVCPDTTDTPLFEQLLSDPKATRANDDDRKYFQTLTVKSGKVMTPREVALCVCRALDDTSLSGQALLVDPKYPHAILKLPQTPHEVHAAYITHADTRKAAAGINVPALDTPK